VDDGALFLDELLEFDRATLEALRHTARLLETSAKWDPASRDESCGVGGRIVEPATEEDF
jgi:hypothetical protein